MGDKGRRDKGAREAKRPAKMTLKEKRKARKEKKAKGG
jgi:hypothetical protein